MRKWWARRLGCKAVGVDLNPVAWFVTKKEVEPVLEAVHRQQGPPPAALFASRSTANPIWSTAGRSCASPTCSGTAYSRKTWATLPPPSPYHNAKKQLPVQNN